MTLRPNPVDAEIAAATPVRDRRLSAAIDRCEAQIAAAEARGAMLVAAAFRKVLAALLDRVPDR